jgi:Concanavalin A-like lectin/glucanases superfamily
MRRELPALPALLVAFLLVAFLLVPAAARADIPELAGAWHLDSVAATTPDSSGHNLTGTVVGAPVIVNPARFGTGLRFPSEDDYVDAGSHAELQPATITVLAWVRADSVPSQVKAIVTQGAEGSCAYSSYSLYTGGSLDAAGLRFYVHVGGGVVKVSPPADNGIWNGQWHLVAGTYDGAAVRLFVDGQEVGPATPASGPIGYGLSVNNDFVIGGAKAPACIEQTNFTGDVDEVRVYSRALTGDELAYLARPDHTAPPELPIPAGLPPPPAPPGAPPTLPTGRNTQPPSIQTGNLDGGLRVYSCLPGTWADINEQAGFTYTWWRQNRSTSATTTVPDTNVQSGADPLYKLPTADIGKAHYCEVTATGLDGQPTRASSTPRILTGEPDSVTSFADTGLPVPYGNVMINGIDVIQVTQPNFRSARFPLDDPIFPYCGSGVPTNFHLFLGECQTLADDPDPQRARYRGVTLDARKRTFALVYLAVEDQFTPFPLRLLDITLTARIGDEAIGEDWRFAVNPRIRFVRTVSFGERTDPTGESRVAFELNPAWLAEAARRGAELSLTARADIAPGLEGLLSECLGTRDCLSDNRFQVDGVPVRDELPDLMIKPIAMLRHNQRLSGGEIGAGYILAQPDDVLRRVRQLFPGGDHVIVLSYKGVIDIDLVEVLREVSPYCQPYDSVQECRETYVTTVLEDWLSGQPNRTFHDILMAVHHFHERPGGQLDAGWSLDWTLRRGNLQPHLFAGDGRQDDGTLDRPITGTGHIFGHAMGAGHAGTLAEDPATGRACVAAPRQLDAEPWPDDETGRLQSAALDPDTVLLRMDRSDTPMFDFMSNCAVEGDAWISAFNWARAFETMREYGAVPIGARLAASHRDRATATRAGQAYVSGLVGPHGAKIVRVVPADPQNNPPEPDPSSPLQVRVLDAGGRELGVIGAPIRHSSQGSPAGTFVVAIPSGAAAVELVASGQVLDRKERSRTPTVRVRSPRAGSRVRGAARSALTVRWTASDPDGDELDATVEYAANGRSGWRPIFKGLSTGSATLPGRFLERGSGARIRVRVNDGFNEAVARSGRFDAEGTPPVARIVLPQTPRLPAPGRVELRGTAFDDRDQLLPGRALTWFAGKRRLGRGDHVRVRLRAGTVKLRLQARDRFGRVATAVRRVKVNPVQIQIRSFTAPAHVAKGARSMRVSVATSTAARLRARGRSFAVGPRTRTLTIPLPARPATGILKIKVSVTARGPRQRVLQDLIRVVRS